MVGCLSIAPAGQAPADLHYRLWDNGGPLVLLVHELGGALWSWERIAPRISAAGFRVAAFDQRGSGVSEKTPGPYTMDHFADDLSEVCRALSPGSPVLLGGLAMGAVIGLHFACRHPDLVEGLALFSPAASIGERARRYLRDRAELVECKGMRAAFETSFANAFPMPCGNEVASGYRRQFLANCPAAYASTSRALADFEGYASLENVRTPTLLVSGRHDFIWPPEHGAALAQRIPSSRLVVAEEAGHFPPLQTPDHVEQMLIPFLQEVSENAREQI